MIVLKEVNGINFNDCMALERKSERFVGDAAYVLAEAYLYREDSTAYGIYNDEELVGLVILRDRPHEKPYSFTDLFIADQFQNKGYGTSAVKAIIDKFKKELKSNVIEIQVHESNEYAIKSYRSNGFKIINKAKWNDCFLVMQLFL